MLRNINWQASIPAEQALGSMAERPLDAAPSELAGVPLGTRDVVRGAVPASPPA